MMTGKEELLEALIGAYLMEKGTREFYVNAAAKAGMGEAGEIFHLLSGWEDRHMHFIQFLYQAIQDDRAVGTFDEFMEGTEAPETEGGIPVKDLERKVELPVFAGDRGALTVAYEIEEKALALYESLAAAAGDGNARVVFIEMMEEERKHIGYLDKLKAKLM